MYSYSPPETKVTLRPGLHEKQIAECVSHVSKGWFPVNGELLREIRDKAAQGAYESDPQGLLGDLQRDQALFGYCVKNFQRIAGYEKRNFVEDLPKIPREDLLKLLDVSEQEISSHNFSDAAKPQAVQLKQSVLTCSAATVIGEKLGAKADDAYCCAFLRQLGVNLIAWNYPNVYSKALSRARAGKSSLDELLEQALGISPLKLGVRVSSDWPLSQEVKSSMSAKDPAGKLDSELSTLLHVARLSELFAKAHDEAYFPVEAKAWQSASQEIIAQIGEDGLRKLEEQADKVAALYVPLSPELFSSILPSNPPQATSEATEWKAKFEANQYAQRCPKHVREAIESIYRHMTEGTVSEQAVRDFAIDVVPAAGFLRGCIYLTGADSLRMRPALRFGDKPLPFYSKLTGRGWEAISETFVGNTPSVREILWQDGSSSIAALGALGGTRRLGVLYLEVSDKLISQRDANLLVLFKAVRHTLHDILSLT